MAQYNNVFLYGVAETDAEVIQDDGDGTRKTVTLSLTVVNSSRPYGESNNYYAAEYSHVKIVSGNKDIRKNLEKVRRNDILIVSGTLNTRNVSKVLVCENCSTKFNAVSPNGDVPKTLGMDTFVTPIDFEVIDKKYGDMSTEVLDMGTDNYQKNWELAEIT